MKIIYQFLIIFFSICAILTPWITNGMLNPDLLVLSKYIQTVAPLSTLLESFYDNTLLVNLFVKIFPNIPPLISVFLLQNLSVLFFTYTLMKYVNPIRTLSIILFCFFTIFLNQFRFGFSIALCFTSYIHFINNKYFKTIFFFILGFIFHFFCGIWFGIILILYTASKRKWFKNKWVYIVVSIILILLYKKFSSQDVDSLRFYGYLTEGDAVASKTYIFTFLFLGFYYSSLSIHLKLFLVFTSILTFILSFLPSLSGRIGELTIVTLLCINDNIQKEKKDFKKYFQIFGLLIAFTFFIYRFNNWVILKKVEIPVEIMS